MYKGKLVGVGALGLLTVAALTSSTTASTREPGVNAGGISARATTECFSTHKIGAGVYSFTTCFTKDGNVVQFEVGNPVGSAPGVREHIRVLGIAEGYALCSVTGVHGYDFALGETGFNAASKSQPGGPNTLPLTITRDTADGMLRMVQKFAIESRKVTVSMTVKNRTSSTITGVLLSRIVDPDIDGDAGDDLASTDNRSARAWDNPAGGSLALGAPTNNRLATTSVGNAAGEDFVSCAPLPGVSVKGPGDQSLKATYEIGALDAGQTSKPVNYVYTGS